MLDDEEIAELMVGVKLAAIDGRMPKDMVSHSCQTGIERIGGGCLPYRCAREYGSGEVSVVGEGYHFGHKLMDRGVDCNREMDFPIMR